MLQSGALREFADSRKTLAPESEWPVLIRRVHESKALSLKMETVPLHARGYLDRLVGLRRELADFAYTLDRQSRIDAADAVMTIFARVAELAEELETGSSVARGSASVYSRG